MRAEKSFFMTRRRSVTLLMTSLALIFMGVALNYISSTSPSITGMVQTNAVSPNLRNLKYMLIIFILAVFAIFAGYTIKNHQK